MDKEKLKAQKAELENIINISKGIVEESEQKIEKINKLLKELETFTPSLSVDAFYYGGNRDKFTLSGSVNNERCYELGNEIQFHKIANSVFAMIDLAIWCNSQNEKDELNVEYRLFYKFSDAVINFAKYYGVSSCMVSFNSAASAKLAIAQINSNPELKRLALIFLGGKDERGE